MRSRFAAVLAALALATTAGCGSTAPAAMMPAGDSGGLGVEEVRVGLAFDTGGRGDKSFNDAAAAGLDRAVRELEVRATEVTLQQETEEDRAESLRELAEQGNNPVIAVGFLYAGAVEAVAEEFPQTTFAIVDDASFEAPNVVSLVFAEEQGSYLAGAAAALTSASGRIAFIGGVDFPLLHKFQAGYVAGARAVRPDVQVDVGYLSAPPDFSGFGAPEEGAEMARGMLAGGADVVYAAAGASGAGVVQAVAATPGAHVVGVDSDQYSLVDETARPAVLTSMLKRVDNAVFQEIQAFIKGDRAGGVKRFDLEVDGVGYSKSNQAAIAPVERRVDELRQQILDGLITVPDVP